MSFEAPQPLTNSENPVDGTRLVQAFIENIKAHDHLLDLGARDGWVEQMAFSKEPNLTVTAVDKMSDEELAKELIRSERVRDERITWVITDVVEYVRSLAKDQKFQGILAQNIFQFLDKKVVLKELLPRLQQSIAPGGQLAIRTFSAEPEPPFEKPFTSLYRSDDLLSLFPEQQWDIRINSANKLNLNSLRNDKRDFSLVDFQAVKKK